MSEWVSCWETIKRANNVYDSLLRSGRNKFLILLWAIKCNMWKSTKRLIKFRFSWPSGVSDSTPSESKPTMGNVWLFSFSASPLHSLIGFHKSSDTRAIQGNGKSSRDLDECHNFLQFTGYSIHLLAIVNNCKLIKAGESINHINQSKSKVYCEVHLSIGNNKISNQRGVLFLDEIQFRLSLAGSREYSRGELRNNGSSQSAV